MPKTSRLPLLVSPLLLAALAALAGCGGRQSASRSFAVQMCRANIPVYAPGQVPQVPYRMIAPVDSRWGISVTSRFEHMKASACALGADAIIDAPDRYPQTRTVTTTTQYDAAGRPVAVQEQAVSPAWRSTPIAIKFLAPIPMPAAGSVAPLAMAQPQPGYVFVPPPQQITIVAPPPDVTFAQAPPAGE
jgi:hypothetical protein